MLNLVRRRYLWFAISLIMIIPGLISLAVFQLELGVDFAGGTRWEFHMPSMAEPRSGLETEINNLFQQAGIESPRTTLSQGETNGQTFAIASVRTLAVDATAPEKVVLENLMAETYGTDTILDSFQTVGETVRTRAIRDAILAVFFASVAILIYLAMAFRNTPHPLRYGACAILAMLHDVILVIGMASILGVLIDLEVDALFLTALLTTISFSVHDTIVVFDRVRENVQRSSAPYEEIVNRSLVQTLTRSINTQFTSLFTLVALLLFGGESIRSFILILLIGLLSGTYSSLFNAAQFLVVWENREWRNWFKGNKTNPTSETV